MQNTINVENLVRPDIAGMEPYKPIVPFEVLSEELGRPIEDIVKLDANENLYGPSPKALEAVAALHHTVPIYPDPQARKLRHMLSDVLGVDSEYVFVGAGADELIDLTMRLFIEPGDKILNCPPTFGMYKFDAALVAAEVVNVTRKPDFSLDIDAIEKAVAEHQPKLLFVTSPNNPDGGLLSQAQLERLLKLPIMIMLDQAYVEFSATPAEANAVLQRIPNTPNLAVLRTFSKWAGLAGLRVGYGVYPLWLMEHLWKIKQPYNLNIAADAAARGSLDDIEWLYSNLARIRAERDRLFAELQALSYIDPYPSKANFILCKVKQTTATAVRDRLRAEGVLIRYYNKPGLEDHIRVAIGKPEHSEKLMSILKQIEAELA